MPKYKNQCEHPPWAFYGTVHLFNTEGDLYFYVDRWGEWNYCFRRGPDGEYASMTMHCRPISYAEDMDRSRVIESTNSRIKLWGCFAKFLATATLPEGKVGGAP